MFLQLQIYIFYLYSASKFVLLFCFSGKLPKLYSYSGKNRVWKNTDMWNQFVQTSVSRVHFSSKYINFLTLELFFCKRSRYFPKYYRSVTFVLNGFFLFKDLIKKYDFSHFLVEEILIWSNLVFGEINFQKKKKRSLDWKPLNYEKR